MRRLASRLLFLLVSVAATALLVSCGVKAIPAESGGANSGGSGGGAPSPAKATPVISWAQPAAITDGTPLGATQLDATANVAGTFAYSPAAGTVLGAGTQTLSTTFTPNDSADYTTAAATVAITVSPAQVSKTTPTITWPQPLPIADPTPLGIVQLDATANVPGTFVYSPGAGAVLPVGTQTLSVTFTPQDSADYNTATATVTMDVVSPAANNLPHIYVGSAPNIPRGIPNIPPATYGYAVADNGQLTPIPGFPLPFQTDGVIFGKFFYTVDEDGVHLDTYVINADGTFTEVGSSIDPAVTPQCICVLYGPTMTDRSGSSLYVVLYDLDNNFFLQTFSIDPTTGKLTYLPGSILASGTGWGFVPVTFSGNDSFLYGDYCTAYAPCSITDLTRGSDGSLLGSPIGNAATGPSSPQGTYYSEAVPQADDGNHLAAIVSSSDDNLNPLNVPNQLVSYTINPDGSLTTTNTTADMPTPAVQPVYDISLSPSGALLAVGGQGGVQLFHFNGAAPLTSDTGLLPFESATEFDAWVAWDNHNHLYALTYDQKLYVFNVTAKGAVEAPGSPHSIPNAFYFFIQP